LGLIKEAQSYLINSYKGKNTTSLMSTNQAKRLINSIKKFVMQIIRPKEDKIAETKLNTRVDIIVD